MYGPERTITQDSRRGCSHGAQQDGEGSPNRFGHAGSFLDQTREDRDGAERANHIDCAGKPAGSASDPRIQEAQKRLPFELVLPTYVPAGYQFDGIHVDDQAPVGNHISADLVYNGPAGQGLQISESNFAVHIGGSGIVEKIKMGMGDAEYQEITRTDGTVRTVAFQVTEKTSATLTTLSLGREELLKVAASMVK